MAAKQENHEVPIARDKAAFIQVALGHQAVLQTFLHQGLKLRAFSFGQGEEAASKVELPPYPGDSGSQLQLSPRKRNTETCTESKNQRG